MKIVTLRIFLLLLALVTLSLQTTRAGPEKKNEKRSQEEKDNEFEKLSAHLKCKFIRHRLSCAENKLKLTKLKHEELKHNGAEKETKLKDYIKTQQEKLKKHDCHKLKADEKEAKKQKEEKNEKKDKNRRRLFRLK